MCGADSEVNVILLNAVRYSQQFAKSSPKEASQFINISMADKVPDFLNN
jgi:hypothetical protein